MSHRLAATSLTGGMDAKNLSARRDWGALEMAASYRSDTTGCRAIQQRAPSSLPQSPLADHCLASIPPVKDGSSLPTRFGEEPFPLIRIPIQFSSRDPALAETPAGCRPALTWCAMGDQPNA